MFIGLKYLIKYTHFWENTTYQSRINKNKTPSIYVTFK